MAFITGYQAQDITKICFFSQNTRQDLCPFLWKKFDEANYLTALIEDVPLLATFNYFKTGFVEQPVDYYFRPFMLGVHYHSRSIVSSNYCNHYAYSFHVTNPSLLSKKYLLLSVVLFHGLYREQDCGRDDSQVRERHASHVVAKPYSRVHLYVADEPRSWGPQRSAVC